MPGIVRRLVIFTTIDNLILQAHGQNEHHKTIGIDFKTKAIRELSKPAISLSDKAVRLDSHGVIGQISVASSSFLIAITQREQVAQVFGKPIYVVKNVALIPLTSQDDANSAISAAAASNDIDANVTDSDYTDSEDEASDKSLKKLPSSPSEEDRSFQQRNSSNTSIAENVATRTVTFGQYASQWLSKRGSVSSRNAQSALSSSGPAGKPQTVASAAETNEESRESTVSKQTITPEQLNTSSNATSALLPKILRSTKMILTSRSYYFSYEFDLTRRLGAQGERPQSSGTKLLNPLYFWNKRIGSAFIESGQEAFLVPIIQGFVGQRTFAVKSSGRRGSSAVAIEDAEQKSETLDRTFLLTLISRRSTKRSGLRYLRRGIDDEGNCANFVESEQILSSPEWQASDAVRSFIQVRGSIPLYFSQSPYSFKPAAVLLNSPQANETAFRTHFSELKRQYGSIQIAMLLDKHGPELPTGNAYEKLYNQAQENGNIQQVDFEWFDFHKECRGMKFENVQKLVTKLEPKLDEWGETILQNASITNLQTGVIRTNCMDCLDRTNVAQSAFAQHRLQKDLEDEGYDIDLVHDESTNWFNTLWADNGDAISRLYAGTAALKGDYTRTRKRNWRGAINDLGLTLSRYYSNMVNDYFSQAVIDLLLGNVSWRVFEDFESSMVSADPGISVQSGREAAVDNCAKIVIQVSTEDLIHGWTMLAPAHENTLRTLPFEEVVVLLTDAAIYCCRLDWTTEKIASFEKVDLRSITKVRYGTYVTSTFTEKQMDENINQGVLIIFSPGKGDTIRVNTRSLQNFVEPGAQGQAMIDGGTGILSWLAPGSSSTPERTMALKIIPAAVDNGDSNVKTPVQTPSQMAELISEDIRRAIVGSSEQMDKMLEAGDIISASEAKKRTGYLEQLGHTIKRFVWT